MKKYILGAVLSLGLLVSPAFTQAAGLTTAQVNSIISMLQSLGIDQSVISNVQAALTGGTPVNGGQPLCHDFNNDMTIGSSDNLAGDVSALHRVLYALGDVTSGRQMVAGSSFNEDDAADVVHFQRKYGIRQTGYVGSLTRAKLNSLYGCSNNQQSAANVPTYPNSSSTQVSAPTATITATPGTAGPLSVSFSVASSAYYVATFDYGDGVPQSCGSMSIFSTDCRTGYTYPSAGTYTIKFIVNGVTWGSKAITVGNGQVTAVSATREGTEAVVSGITTTSRLEAIVGRAYTTTLIVTNVTGTKN